MHRAGYQAHVAAGPVASCGDEAFLRNHDVGTDVDIVLVVEPDALTNPAAGPDVQLPRKLDAGAGPECDARTDLGAEGPQRGDPQP